MFLQAKEQFIKNLVLTRAQPFFRRLHSREVTLLVPALRTETYTRKMGTAEHFAFLLADRFNALELTFPHWWSRI